MKKPLALFLAILITLIPIRAFAVVGTISASGTYDITSYGNGSKITIESGLEVTLTNTCNGVFSDLKIDCGQGVTLTVDSLSIDNSTVDNACALSFMGSGNTLILKGQNLLKSGKFEPGVRVENGTELTISGDGSLDVLGGIDAAGIGGGFHPEPTALSDGGDITITSGTVTATGGNGIYGETGAGIGGGANGAAGNITIMGTAVVIAKCGFDGAGIGSSGWRLDMCRETAPNNITISGSAKVTAQGGKLGGAGIGGGTYDPGGNITITENAVVKALGGNGGAGIGGGYNGDAGTIVISGGTVEAAGSEDGVGIGGLGESGDITISGGYVAAQGGSVSTFGSSGPPGIGGYTCPSNINITITGGTVFAARYNHAPYEYGDIEPGRGTLTINNSAAVFMKNDLAPDTVTFEHMHFGMQTASGGNLYGIALPDGWTSAGAYILARQIIYDDNGGTGAYHAVQHRGTDAEIGSGTGLYRPGYTFGGWNTKADGNGKAYATGDTITLTDDLTLYAQWKKTSVSEVTLSSDTEMITIGDILALSADVSPSSVIADITWTSSDSGIVTVNDRGIVTVTGPGTATVTATAGGASATCDIVVLAPAQSVALSSTFEQLDVGDTVLIMATVSPQSTQSNIGWTSSDDSVATVDSNGNVTAVSEGTTAVIACADVVVGVCVVMVGDAAQTTSVAANDETPTVDDAVSLAAAVSVPLTQPHSVQHSEGKGTITVAVHVGSLPEGTKTVKTPDGKIAPIGPDGLAHFEIDSVHITEEGTLHITALDESGAYLGTAHVQVKNASTSGWETVGPILMWVLIGMAANGLAGLTLFFVRRKRAA